MLAEDLANEPATRKALKGGGDGCAASIVKGI